MMRWGRKHVGGLTGVLVMLSLVPVLYCGIFNYASADDFSKSYTVHNVLLAGGNVLDAIYASIQAAANVWEIWEGTWASNFFLAFQPSIWGEHAYAITVPLCILYTAVGTGYVLRELLVQWLGMTKKAYWVIFWLQLFFFLQYMPYIRGGMFWYTGMAHYVMPMCFSLLMTAWMLKWERTGKRRYLIFMLLDGAYLGGSHYQHIILVLLILLSGWLWSLLMERNHQRRMSLLWIPIIEILIGLYFCIISPGNLTRGGEGFGLHPSAILLMPFSCMIQGLQHMREYFVHVPLLMAYVVLVFFLGVRLVRWDRLDVLRRIPVGLILLYLFLLYASIEAPGIYAAGNTAGISGGYFDIVYQTMILTMTVALLLLGSWVRFKAMEDRRPGRRAAVLAAAGILLFMLWGVKPGVKQSAAYLCYDFARSGRLRDFVIQMEERIELLNDPGLEDIYVPEMNDDQGPFMHLQLSEDKTNYTNESTALYYHKHSVTAVPREQYYKEYAGEQGHGIPEAYRDLYSE